MGGEFGSTWLFSWASPNDLPARAGGENIVDEDVARISPLTYQQVTPNGTYDFTRRKPGDDIA